jgi:hypothetical protein
MKNEQLINASELRNIILGLKMSNFSFIEDEKLCDQINYMIEQLPSPELLNGYIEKKGELGRIRENVGYIMSCIEKGGRKDEAFKSLYEAKKNIPPRYQVLKWRSAMNKELVKGLVRISSVADENKSFEIAEKSIILAKKAVNDEISNTIVADLISDCKKGGLEKEANWLQDQWDKLTNNPGRTIQRNMDKQKHQEQKSIQQQNTTTLNSLVHLSKMFENNEYDTASISQLINSIQDPTVKAQLKRYSDYIAQVESEFSNQIQSLSDKSNDMIQTYQQTGGQTFFKEEAPQIEQQIEPEVKQQDELGDINADIPSETTQNANNMESQIGRDVIYENTRAKIKNVLPDGSVELEYVGGQTATVSVDQIPNMAFASSQKSIRLSSRKKWIRIV